MLTAAVRDLHQCYPGRFVTDVRTSCVELWDHNPYLTPLDETDSDVEVIDCEYPLINRCNQAPYHCIHGFIEFLNDRLGLSIKPAVFKGDIHLSNLEKSWFSQVHELTGEDTPFWIIVAGGKYDATVKWWSAQRYQEVVDHFRGKIQFVQTGEWDHYHPKLDGVIDLRGRTSLRELVRLVYHSQGVLCPVTAVMHLAAAVEVKGGRPQNRPCVVVAGGREPVHWEAYTPHQFIHTIGALPCCEHGGCWRCRTVPLGDGTEWDQPQNLCLNVAGNLPRCMDMISSAEVIRRIETYFSGGVIEYLSPIQAQAAEKGILATQANPFDQARLNIHNARLAAEKYIQTMPTCPGGAHGRGVVICGGGARYFTNAWVCINMLRRLECTSPIELWFLDSEEFDPQMEALVTPLGVKCVNAEGLRARHPVRHLGGWGLKPYAILHCAFKEVLLLDADNVPVVNPEFLFETPQFKETGAIFWPDRGRLAAGEHIWGICGVSYQDEPEFESGQIVVDKQRCWRPLQLALWYNQNSDFFYDYIYGDKDTFHLAFRKLDQPYAMPDKGLHLLQNTFCQHDFQGRRIFQHRNYDKWDLFLRNKSIKDFWFEAECRDYVRQLQQRWDGRIEYFKSRSAVRGTEDRGSRIEDRYPLSSILNPRSSPGPVSIRAVMISCANRDRLRQRTLRNLAASDWGDEPVFLQMDGREFASAKDSATYTSYLALEQALRSQADYILFLEDDLEFNRFLRHNLNCWKILQDGEINLASLYNPHIKPVAFDIPNHAFVAEPHEVYGSQAFLLSLRTVEFVLEHWQEEAGNQDYRMARLAGRLDRPLYYHVPSLVQHVGRKSVWGGFFHQAADYDPLWKAPE